MKFNLDKIMGKKVHCDTEEKANELLKFLHENGFVWSGGNSLLDGSNWCVYRKNTYYNVEVCEWVTYGNINGPSAKEEKNVVEFENVLELEGGNQMYHNLVFINHWSGGKNYLFKLPMNIQLKAGDKVFVITVQGETMGYCVSDSFIVDNYTKQQIASGTGAYEPLKEVKGLAQEQTGYRCIEFGLPF